MGTKVTKPRQGKNCACCGQNFACSGRYCTCRSKIWHLRRQKFACLKVVLSFFLNFLSFFGFSMVKIDFLQRVLKKWSSFRKNKIRDLKSSSIQSDLKLNKKRDREREKK